MYADDSVKKIDFIWCFDIIKQKYLMRGEVMQKRLMPGRLLDDNGCLQEAGSCYVSRERNTGGLKSARDTAYQRMDYYLICNEHFELRYGGGQQLYMGLVSISFLDFEQKRETTVSPMTLLPMGRTGMPSSLGGGRRQVWQPPMSVFIRERKRPPDSDCRG